MDFLFSYPMELLALLACVGFIAGFIDAISGGGGLITIPALIINGFDPISALMINKLQSTFGSGTASLSYYRRGLITEPWIILACAAAFIGSVIGTYTLFFISPKFLLFIIPIMLIVIALYFAFSPMSEHVIKKPKISTKLYTYVFMPLIGFYDGFFGPGTGSMLTLLNHAGMGQTLRKAIAHAKPPNFATNIASLFVFALNGQIIIIIGLAMGFGQIVGAQLGSRTASKHGAKVARPLLIITALTLAGKLIYDQWL